MEQYNLEEAIRKRSQALTNGNCRLFYHLSEELGMHPETQYERDLYDVGSLESVSKELSKKENSRLISKIRDMETRDKKLIEAVDSAGINFRDSVRGLNEKERIFRQVLGYDRLRTGKGQFTQLEDCKPERINMMLRREYNSAIKRSKGNSK